MIVEENIFIFLGHFKYYCAEARQLDISLFMVVHFQNDIEESREYIGLFKILNGKPMLVRTYI